MKNSNSYKKLSAKLIIVMALLLAFCRWDYDVEAEVVDVQDKSGDIISNADDSVPDNLIVVVNPGSDDYVAVTDSNGEGDNEAGAKGNTESNTEADAEGNTESNTEADAEGDTESDTEVSAEGNTESNSEAGTEGTEDNTDTENPDSEITQPGEEDTEAGGAAESENENQTDIEEVESEDVKVPEPEAEVPDKPIDMDAYVQSLLVKDVELNEEGIPVIAELPLESNDARYMYLTGAGVEFYTVGNMPKGFRSEKEAKKRMKEVELPIWKMASDGSRYPSTYTISIHEGLVDSVRCIFSEIYNLELQFPVKYLAGFMYRKVGGVGLKSSKLMSAHSFGAAIDINPADEDNDYYLGYGNDLRNKDNPYCIPDEVIEIFRKYGWFWGGDFDICSDTMHFQYIGLEFLQYDSEEPFPILERGKDVDSAALKNMQQRLVKLGYLDKVRSYFSKAVLKAVMSFQEANGLEPDGIVDYETWEPLINQTHDMSYVF